LSKQLIGEISLTIEQAVAIAQAQKGSILLYESVIKVKGFDSLFVTQFINSVCKQRCRNNDVIETLHFYWSAQFSIY
jgi:hypothetical protein